MGTQDSGVGVLDKSVSILSALEHGPATLNDLVTQTGIPRPTAHRLAAALTHHRFIGRSGDGRYELGPRIGELAAASSGDHLLAAAGSIVTDLRDRTQESVQVFRRYGAARMCIAAAERRSGLRDSIPVGTTMSMRAGSAAQVLLAWEDPTTLVAGLRGARFSAQSLAAVRERGWAQSVGEREAGVASVSAPVRGPRGTVVAALSVSGPIERLTRNPGRLLAAEVTTAAGALSKAHAQGAPNGLGGGDD
jgi:DNA-binding IclR family transcriptional regulator